MWPSLLQTLLDKSHGTQSTAELWVGLSISFFLPALLAFKFLLKVESLIHRQKKSCLLYSGHFP